MLFSNIIKAQEPKKQELFEEKISFLSKCVRANKSFSASFVEERIHRLGTKTEHKGSVLVGRSSHFRMSYENGDVIASNGKIIQAWNKNTGTFIETPFTSEPLARILWLLIRNDEATIKKDFDIELLGKHKGSNGQDYQIIELKQNNLALSKLVFVIGQECLAIKRVLIVDAAGTISRITFFEKQINVPVKASDFFFKPKKGIRIIRP